MKQLNIYAQASVSNVLYQWFVYQDGDLARVDMYQSLGSAGWERYPGQEQRLHGGSAEGLLEETVSHWLARSVENGHNVRRLV